MITYKLNENPLTSDYGTWECPECQSLFAGGGKAIHRTGCSRSGYDGLIYHYTQAEVDRWESEVKQRGYCANLPLSPGCLSNYFLKQAIGSGLIAPDEVARVTRKYVESLDPKYVTPIMEKLEELIKEAIGDVQ